MYQCIIVRRTNISLDIDLLEQAAGILGTERITDTVHEALRDVVARSRRTRLAERGFEELTPDVLGVMRRSSGRAA